MGLKNVCGFTIIELLVTISIIGILASIIIVTLNDTRMRARDVSALASMSSIRASAVAFFNENDTFDDGTIDVCADTEVVKLRTAAETETGNTSACNSDSSSYAVWIQLRSLNYFCVDSNNFSADIGVTPPVAGSKTCS